MIWNMTLPISKKARGGVLIPEVEYMNSSLRLDILEANFYVHKVTDLYFILTYFSLIEIETFLLIIPPKRSLGGYIGVTRWSVGWSVGRSVGRSGGRSVGRSSGPLRFPFPIQLHTMIKHMERKCSAQEK